MDINGSVTADAAGGGAADTAACGVTGQQPIRYRPASRAITINCTSVVPSPISRILLSR